MDTAYDIGVRLSMETAGFSSAVGIASKLFGDLEGKAGSADRAVAKIAGSMGITTDQLGRFSQATGRYATEVDAAASAHERLGAAMKGVGLVAGGAALTAVGVGLVGFMDSAVQRAMALQTIMIGVAERTGVALNDPRLTRLQDQFTAIGMTNQMSMTEVAGVAQAASRAGITDLGQLAHMLKPLANYSEVMLRSTGADPAESAKTAVEFAHLYGAFGDKTIGGHVVNGKTVGGVSDTQYLVNQLGKAMQIVPGTQGQFLTLLSSFVGTERPLYKGKPPQALISDTISEAVLLSQMGQGQRGGNQIARIITNMMGGARGKMALTAVNDIQRVSHIHFANAQGQINDPSLLLKALATTAEKLNPRQTLVEFSHAFAANGARLAGLFADPVVGQRLGAIAAAMKAMPDNEAQKRAYNASTAGQFNQANKNFDSAMTELGILWLPIATQAANALAGFTAGLVQFAQQHHTLMAFAATFVAVTAAASLIIGPLVALAGIVAIVGGVTGLALIVPVIVTVVAIGAAIAAVTLIIMNWGTITRTVGAAFSAFGTTLHALTQWVADHIPGFGGWKDPQKESVSVGDKQVQVAAGAHRVAYDNGKMNYDLLIKQGPLGLYALLPGQKDPYSTPLPRGQHPSRVAVDVGGKYDRDVPYGARRVAYDDGKMNYDLPIKMGPHGYYALLPGQKTLPSPGRSDGGGGHTTIHHHAPPAVVHHQAAPTMRHLTHSAVVHHHAAPTTVHLHVAAGAVVNHIAPGHGHDPKTIADEVTKRTGEALGHHMANALRTSGLLPSTTRPTLHQLGTT